MHTYVSTSKNVHGHMHTTLKTAVSLFSVLIMKRRQAPPHPRELSQCILEGAEYRFFFLKNISLGKKDTSFLALCVCFYFYFKKQLNSPSHVPRARDSENKLHLHRASSLWPHYRTVLRSTLTTRLLSGGTSWRQEPRCSKS